MKAKHQIKLRYPWPDAAQFTIKPAIDSRGDADFSMKSQPLAITRLVIFRAITRHANFSSLLRDSASPR